MASKVTASRESLSTGAAWVGLGWGLGSLCLQRFRKLRHVGHIGAHSGEANGGHVGLRHVERRVHHSRGAIASSVLHVAVHRGLGISRVFRSVGGVGTVHGELGELLEDNLLWGRSLRNGLSLSAGLLVQHVGDAHNFTGSWRRHD